MEGKTRVRIQNTEIRKEQVKRMEKGEKDTRDQRHREDKRSPGVGEQRHS